MIRRRYRCVCAYEFDYDHHPSIEADPCPRFCPRCGNDSEADDPLSPAVVAPHIAGPMGKLVDGQYRQMEQGADYRAELAQQQFGLSADDVAGLKMTNMRDNARQGEMTAMPVVNDVSRMIEQNPGRLGYQGSNGLGYAAAVTEGPLPNAGARAMQDVRRAHAAFTANAGHAGATMSDMPALETQMPGYRRRV